jgi:hypothetical protein
MAVVQTNMRDLLLDLKALAKSYMDGGKSTNLKGLKTLKRGILSPNTIYPAIVFLPISEQLNGYRNGGVYKVDRTVNIELWTKLGRVDDTSKFLQELCHFTYDMLQFDTSFPDNWKFPNGDEDATVFFMNPGAINYETISGADSLLQRATLLFTFSSWEQAPTFTIRSTIVDTDLRNIGEYVHDILKADSSLDSVKFFYSHSSPPIQVGNGVVVSVKENVDEHNRRESGRDNPTGYIDVIVWTKASPYEGTLDLNLETIEKIKDVLQADQQLGGKAYRSYVDRVIYGVNYDSMLYTSVLKFNTWAYKKMPSEVTSGSYTPVVGD